MLRSTSRRGSEGRASDRGGRSPSRDALLLVGLLVAALGLREDPARAGAITVTAATVTAATVELGLPFEGVWGVVQGFDSGDTHRGYAAFALDFAPPQDVARFARLAHPRLEDFACYGRPVLAPADGRVVRVATAFPDLAPYAKVAAPARPARKKAPAGAPANANSGNFVIIQHAPGVYTELVHLAAGSVAVEVGQAVRRGQRVGACGNSGNARTPHLHLGLLTSIDPIATGRMKLARYEVRAADGRWRPGDGEPKEGDWVRPAAPPGPSPTQPSTQSSGR